MGKLFKYLLNYKVATITVIILLFVQANADLLLPDYTSKIINVGVQQSGIESTTPEYISTETMELLAKVSTSDQYSKISDNYIKENDIYFTLINDDEELSPLIEGKYVLLASLNSEQISFVTISEKLNIPVNSSKELINIISNMNDEQKKQILSGFDEMVSEMPKIIAEQGAISYIKADYELANINVDKIQSDYIIIAGAQMLAIALISMIIAVTVSLIGSIIAAKIGKSLRDKVYKKTLSFSANEFNEFGTASLITRSTNDIQQVQSVMVMLIRIIIYAPILGIGGFMKVLNTSPGMAWIIGVVVSVLLIILTGLFIMVIPKFRLAQKLMDKLNLVSREILTGIPVIRAFSNQKYEEDRFDNVNVNLTKNNLFINRVISLMMPLMMFIMNVTAVLIVYVGAKNIDAGTMQVGDMMAFIQYTIQIIMAFVMITVVSIMIPRATVSAGRIEEVLNTESKIKDPETPKTIGKIDTLTFEDVSFSYGRAEEEVLKNINFTAKKGQTIAFIGSTGSGKSTIVNLIPRFYDVTSGYIKLNGIDIRKITQFDLHSKIGLVPQKGLLFSGTIGSNIKYANDKLTDSEMKNIAEIAQADDFINEKEDNYNSVISQGGTNVSGGQKQRLAISRAIATNPDIYIFDDSFSALDYKTDYKLRTKLKKITKDNIVLIVAQRVSTIMNADQIIVLDDGEIKGIGTHKELLKTCSVYEEIASSQLSKEELANG